MSSQASTGIPSLRSISIALIKFGLQYPRKYLPAKLTLIPIAFEISLAVIFSIIKWYLNYPYILLKLGNSIILFVGKIITKRKRVSMSKFNYQLLNKLIKLKYKNNKNFAQKLKSLGLKISEEAVKKWRQGNATPRAENLPIIAEALDITEQDLFAPEKKEKIAIEEFMKSPAKYQQYIKDKYDQLPPAIKEIVENLLYLGPEEIDLYYAEIKAKALRKKEIERDVKIGKN